MKAWEADTGGQRPGSREGRLTSTRRGSGRPKEKKKKTLFFVYLSTKFQFLKPHTHFHMEI